MKFLIIFFTISVFNFQLIHGNSIDTLKNFYIHPEISLGKIAPNYSYHFPKNNFYSGLTLNFGYQTNGTKSWHHHYNFPKTGIAISFLRPGNDSIFGYQINVYPYITINAARKKDEIFDFKFGIGTSYYTIHYDSISNPENLDIGSHFNWYFYAFMFKQWKLNLRNDLYIGIGFMHSSNGHTQMPNFGLNSAIASFGIYHYLSEKKIYNKKENVFIPTKEYGVISRTGLGFHELGSSTWPVGGEKFPIYTYSLSAFLTQNKFTRFRGGFEYKYYTSYYDYIHTNSLSYANTKLASSAFSFFLGCEFLMGRMSIDLEGGLHLYRPFYKKFFSTFEGNTKSFDYFLKNLFITKMGIHAYLYKLDEKRKNNYFIGATINAHFGQADFSEICFGYVLSF